MGVSKKIYRNIYKRCPKIFQSRMSRLVMLSPNKPSVKTCNLPRGRRFPDNYKGALIISADFEMAWAWRYAKSGINPENKGIEERNNIPALIKLFEEYKIPVTWATVGHLFLKECSKLNKKPHSNMARIPYFTNKVWSYQSGDWYDHDPGSNVRDAPAWYAPDLIEQIKASVIKHEIGCHTFSHIDCSDKYCPEKVLTDEISACVEVARLAGIELKSMVFPGGTNGNYAVLKKYGFTNYRINAEWDLFYPEKDNWGLWKLPSSASIENHGFGWDVEFYTKIYKKYIDRAIETGTVCHLWFHPSIDQLCLFEIFPRLLDYACRVSEKRDLWICTMAEMASFCERKHGS